MKRIFSTRRQSPVAVAKYESIIDDDYSEMSNTGILLFEKEQEQIQKEQQQQQKGLDKLNVKKQSSVINKLAEKSLTSYENKAYIGDEAKAAVAATMNHIHKEFYSDMHNYDDYSILHEFPSIELSNSFEAIDGLNSYYGGDLDSISFGEDESESSNFSGKISLGSRKKKKIKKNKNKAGVISIKRAIERGSRLGKNEDSEPPAFDGLEEQEQQKQQNIQHQEAAIKKSITSIHYKESKVVERNFSSFVSNNRNSNFQDASKRPDCETKLTKSSDSITKVTKVSSHIPPETKKRTKLNVETNVYRMDESNVSNHFSSNGSKKKTVNPNKGGDRSIVKQVLSKFRAKNNKIGNEKTIIESILPDQSSLQDALWMCGVCGKAFISLQVAEKHEYQHVKDIVRSFGWVGDSTCGFLALPKKTTHDKNNTYTSGIKITDSASLSILTRGENRGGSSKNTSSGKVSTINDSDRHLPVISNSSQYTHTIDSYQYRQKNNASLTQTFKKMSIIEEEKNILSFQNTMNNATILADEALVEVCTKFSSLILTQDEVDAERELSLLSKDKLYYDNIILDAMKRKQLSKNGKYNRSEGKTFLSKVQNKFVDAYQLMKEGDTSNTHWFLSDDLYMKKKRRGGGGQNEIEDIATFPHHSNRTLYVNVMVRNSIQVVNHELKRLAKQKWAHDQITTAGTNKATQFEKFRALAHGKLVKLAGLALASDFTPRRIAKQLSNELYQLLKPRMNRRGVQIVSDIEYRVGPYFVLSVTIATIDWTKLLKVTHKEVKRRNAIWRQQKQERSSNDDSNSKNGKNNKIQSSIKSNHKKNKGDPDLKKDEEITNTNDKSSDDDSSSKRIPILYARFYDWLEEFRNSIRMTRFDVLAQIFSLLYYAHWVIHFPICFILYNTFLGSTIRAFIISTVIDEIFYYVEEKGMEMEIEVRKASMQASFMLSALREMRIGDQKSKKKRQDVESETASAVIIGPLLGPLIALDKVPIVYPSDEFIMPNNLEFIGLEIDLPVGFRRLRWAILHSESEFLKEAVYRNASKFDTITFGSWSKYDDCIGCADLPDDIKEEDFVGAEKETSFIIPKSAFVSANMCYETQIIESYSDHTFCIKKRAFTPDVPYGKTFKIWTKYIITNNGNNTCRLVCSVEAEFPNGPPMISRQIVSGMRGGTAESFVSFSETICNYADHYPK